MTTKKKPTKTNNDQGEETVSKKKEGLVPRDEMIATGKPTGKVAKLTFQADGKIHEKGKEVLGVDEKVMKELESQGLIEDK